MLTEASAFTGLELNEDRPDDKLPYRGAWLWMGPEMIHLMELPNPDPLEGRPEHGGRDRHFCVGVQVLHSAFLLHSTYLSRISSYLSGPR